MADERTGKPPVNANDALQDRTIRHMVFLERYKSGQVTRIRNVLERDVLPSIEDKLRRRLEAIKIRGSDPGQVTTKRLIRLERELRGLVNNMTNDLQADMTGTFRELSESELDFQIKAIRESLDFDIELVVPNMRSVVRVVKNTSFAGSTLDQWYNSLSRSTQRRIMQQVNRGIVEGETTPQIMRRIKQTHRTTTAQTEAITRSAINHASNQTRLELFKENDDLIKGLQWVATLDARTSTICAGLDGKVFKIDKGARPPAHPNCRSTMTPVLKSARAYGVDKVPPTSRASMDGQVPATTTYGDWLRKQPVEIQNEVLGVKKARLFRQGGLPIERFTTSNLRPLTLAELRERNEKSFKKADL